MVVQNYTITEERYKAQIYLEHGTRLVWIVYPVAKKVEVCRLDIDKTMKIEVKATDENLSGENVLPKFAIEIKDIFAVRNSS